MTDHDTSQDDPGVLLWC